MKLELKRIKHARNMSRETNAFTCDVYIDGVLVGEALNDGGGGCTFVYAAEGCRNRLHEVNTHFRALPPHQSEYGPLPMSLDFAIDLAIEEDLKRRDMARRCKGKTAFKLKSQSANEFFTIKKEFSPQMKDYLQRTYGEDLEIIYNETL